MKKIAFISTNDVAPWGGSEDLWFESAKAFREEGYEVTVNVKKWPKDPDAVCLLEKLGCKITRRGKRYQKHLLLDKLKGKFKSLYYKKPASVYSVIYEWLIRNQPDCVIISLEMNTSGYTYIKACINAGIPYITIVQSAAENFWPGEKASLNLIEAYSQAKACFFVSCGNIRLTEKQLGYTLSNVSIVRNTYKVSYHAPFTWPVIETYNIACVGRLEAFAKGQDLLLEVLNSEKWRSRNVRLNFYGKGVNEQGLKRLCKLWNLNNLVNFEGFVDNIEEVWQHNHALVLPSRFEGLPIAIVEAMLCGRVCIVTDVAGNAELIEDDVTGFVTRFPTAKALDEAMERAWQNRHLWKEMGERAYIHVRKLIPERPALEFNRQVRKLFI